MIMASDVLRSAADYGMIMACDVLRSFRMHDYGI